MSVSDLEYRLLSDLRSLKLPVDEVDVFFRPFSKTYLGRYFPARCDRGRPKLFIYPFENTRGDLMSYEQVLSTAIHELCHHIQYVSGLVRVKGVMHNEQFWQLYNRYTNRARDLKLCA